MNRIYIKTYGCQMNERDSDAVATLLRDKGYSIVNEEKTADVILLNTCSVREQAEQKAIGKAGYITARKRRNPNLVVGIMGCMAQNKGNDLVDKLPDLDLIIGTQKFHRVPDHLSNFIKSMSGLGPRPNTIIDIEEEKGSQNTIKSHAEEKKVSAFVSIMQGCNMKCSYCIVPKTRGSERARPSSEIISEIKDLAKKGTKEITLLGQIVNQYAVREFPFLEKKSPFVQLLEKVNAIDGIERIRFTSPHPVGFKDDLIECYKRLPKLCEYLHFPMQSGSNRILKAMRRPYSIEKFKHIIEKLRAIKPDIYISTDIIVGFPEENEDDFEATRSAFESIGFDMAYIFKYSVRPGTTAEPKGDPVSREIKEQRNQVLLDILNKSSLARNQSLIGTTQEILLEGHAKRGNNMFTGRTRGYRKVFTHASDRLIGELVEVKITKATASSLTGDLVITN